MQSFAAVHACIIRKNEEEMLKAFVFPCPILFSSPSAPMLMGKHLNGTFLSVGPPPSVCVCTYALAVIWSL